MMSAPGVILFQHNLYDLILTSFHNPYALLSKNWHLITKWHEL